MSNGNGPNISGKEKKMSIVFHAEGYADTTKEWFVPEELIRPYAIAYDAGIAALGLKISKEIYQTLIDAGFEGEVENFMAKPMLNAGEG